MQVARVIVRKSIMASECVRRWLFPSWQTGNREKGLLTNVTPKVVSLSTLSQASPPKVSTASKIVPLFV
jgi:hypothetical protein